MCGDGPAEEPALADIASQPTQQRRHLLGLDALGDGRQAEAVPEADDGRHYLGALFVDYHRADVITHGVA